MLAAVVGEPLNVGQANEKAAQPVGEVAADGLGLGLWWQQLGRVNEWVRRVQAEAVWWVVG